jgi:excisionase family DNA binding protein
MPVKISFKPAFAGLADIISLNLDGADAVQQPEGGPRASAPDRAGGQPPFLSFNEAARWLCVSLSTVKRLVACGDLVAVRIHKRRKISGGALRAYVTKDMMFPVVISFVFAFLTPIYLSFKYAC